jgi:DNA (cytosine-5)-methyltransferase 1
LARKAMGERSFKAGGGKTGFFRRLAWDSPSPTITGKPNRKGTAMCHPSQTRPLSIKECARLQGFPDRWEFAGGSHHQYLQIGNAVPVDLGAAIGRMLQQPRAKTVSTHAELLGEAVATLRASARNKVRAVEAVA